MTSKRETILDALTARIAAALPGAEVKRNAATAERIGPGGLVIVTQQLSMRCAYAA